jgi:hypothetical protein
VAVLSETYWKPHERNFITNYHISQTDHFPGRKGGTAIVVRKGIPYNHVDLPPLVLVEVIRVCIPIDYSYILIVALCKSPGRTWIDADITELLSFRHKPIQTSDLNVKHPFWNSVISNLPGEKLFDLFDVNKFEISALQCPTHHTPDENCDVPDTVVDQNIRLSGVIVSNILDSDHILDHVKTKNLSEQVEKFTNWEWFQSLASVLISPRIEINSEEEVDTTACDFTTFVASAYRLPTTKVTLSDINNQSSWIRSLVKTQPEI